MKRDEWIVDEAKDMCLHRQSKYVERYSLSACYNSGNPFVSSQNMMTKYINLL